MSGEASMQGTSAEGHELDHEKAHQPDVIDGLQPHPFAWLAAVRTERAGRGGGRD